MPKLSLLRRLLKLVHPEGIPWPGTAFYNAVTTTSMFQQHYELLARDTGAYCPSGRILDVGTGPAWLLVKLHRLYPQLQLFGVDASAAMVVQARRNCERAGLSKGVEIQEGNVCSLPFPEVFFDAVISTGSIHHWKDPIGGVNEIYRVLKPGRRALLYDIVSDTPGEILTKVAGEYGRLKMVLFWLHAYEEPFYSYAEYGAIGRQSQFGEGETRFVGALCCLTMEKHGLALNHCFSCPNPHLPA